MDSGKNDINNLSLEELQDLKVRIEQTLKEKKMGIKRKRKPKDSNKRKPTLRVRKGKYIEMYQKDLDGKTVCKYIGKIGELPTQLVLQKLSNDKPELMEEYQVILEGFVTRDNSNH